MAFRDSSVPRQDQSDTFSIPGVKLFRGPTSSLPSSSFRRPSSIASNKASIEPSPATASNAAWLPSTPSSSQRDCTNVHPQSPFQTPGSGLSLQDTARSDHGAKQRVSNLGDGSGWICAINECKDVEKQVGVCLVNMALGKCVVGQFSDTQTHGHLLYLVHVYEPSIVLLPASISSAGFSSGDKSKGVYMLKATFEQESHATVKVLPRAIFDAKKGLSTLEKVAFNGDNTGSHDRNDTMSSLATGHKELPRTLIASAVQSLALGAAGAASAFVEMECGIELYALSMSISHYHPEGTVMIDHKTCCELELVKNAITGKERESLLGVMNFCRTPMGRRLLRLNILQPLAATDDITFRLDVIEELKATVELFMAIREALKAFGAKKIDIEKMTASILASTPSTSAVEKKKAKHIERNLCNIIAIWNFLKTLQTISAQLTQAESSRLGVIGTLFEDRKLQQLERSISDCVNGDMLTGASRAPLSSHTARLYCIKSGIDGVLDAARQTYQENTADALDKCQSYAETYNLPFSTKFSTSSAGGYHLELPPNSYQANTLPREFITFAGASGRAQARKLTTLDLKKCNQRLMDAMTEVFLLSENIVEELCAQIAQNAQALYRASEGLALLDLIMSLTHFAGSGAYVRPTFGETLSIVNGRHPLLDRKNPDGTVPNDTHLSAPKSFLLLTGANNSGKTTYLKQVALLQVMARVGSFVPADRAQFAPLSRILARLNNTDEPEANLSAYANEIKTTLMIIETATSDSLVLIDELGRNTSTHEGLGIAHAVSEVLIARGVPTILSTHFIPLVSTLAPYPSVVSRHFEVGVAVNDAGQSTARFAHRLVHEVDQSVGYGLTIAQTCGLPSDLLADAKAIAQRLQVGARKPDELGHRPTQISDALYTGPAIDESLNQRPRDNINEPKLPNQGNAPEDDLDLDLDNSDGFAQLASEYFNDLHERLYA